MSSNTHLTDLQKIEINLSAIEIIKTLEEENRQATESEKATLSQYQGWGGLSSVFDIKHRESNNMYARAYSRLKELLTDTEFRSVAASITDAFYTPKAITEGIWAVIEQLGFTGGYVLEPTVGTGAFIESQPAHLRNNSKWLATELDTITGGIAKALYNDAHIITGKGFEETPFFSENFDVAVLNPPFSDATITDKTPEHARLNGFKIHEYVIGKTADLLREGGLMAVVVTHRFMDVRNTDARITLNQSLNLIAGFRLPNTAFALAGTEVVTDVLFFQKNSFSQNMRWWTASNFEESEISVNDYFTHNPQNVLGRPALDGTLYSFGQRDEYTVHPHDHLNLDAIKSLMIERTAPHVDLFQGIKRELDLDVDNFMRTTSDMAIGGYAVNSNGKLVKRLLDDAKGNAVIVEVSPSLAVTQDAENYSEAKDALRMIALDAEIDVIISDARLLLRSVGFALKADGNCKAASNNADRALYPLIEEVIEAVNLADIDADKAAQALCAIFSDEARLTAIYTELDIAIERGSLGVEGLTIVEKVTALRELTLELIRAEQNDSPDMPKLREQLNVNYDAFVKDFGFIQSPKVSKLFADDLGVETGLEVNYKAAISRAVAKRRGIEARPESAEKAAIFTERVHFPEVIASHADSATDALDICISELGRVSISRIVELTQSTEEEVLAELAECGEPLIYLNTETQVYEHADVFLSGNVRHKLEVARKAGAERNIQALEAQQPTPKGKDEITVNIRSTWLPSSIFVEFLEALGIRGAKVSINQEIGLIQADGDDSELSDFGLQFRNEHRTVIRMFNAAASGNAIDIYHPRVSDTEPRVKDEKATTEINAQIEHMGKVFSDFVFSSDDKAELVIDTYNAKLNTHRPRSYNGEKYLQLVGMTPTIDLRRTQKNAAYRMVQQGNVLLDHVVGAGKTFTIISGIMERVRLGLTNKALIVVPNHLINQWTADFYALYPSARILAATNKHFERKNRRMLFASIATGRYDAIIIGHSSLGFIPNDKAIQAQVFNEAISSYQEALEFARSEGKSKRTVKQIEKRIVGYELKLKDLEKANRDNLGYTFTDLGIDYLALDESQEFKNLEYETAGERVVGMNDPLGSAKAFDLFMKNRAVEIAGGNVCFATGTPVSNSLVEIYTVQRYLARQELADRGITHFDAWAGAYINTETAMEYTVTGTLKPRRTFTGIINKDSLRQIYESFADIITLDDLKAIYKQEKEEYNTLHGTSLSTQFPVPCVVGGGRQLITGDITPSQSSYFDYLKARMELIENNNERGLDKKEYMSFDNTLKVMTDARKAALDIRVVDPIAEREETSKVVNVARRVYSNYKKFDFVKGTQLVFCDLSVPTNTAGKEADRLLKAAYTLVCGRQEGLALLDSHKTASFVERYNLIVERSEEAELTDYQREVFTKAYIEDSSVFGAMLTADTGFSVYNDLKDILEFDYHIPANEIAFIHDYNSAKDKELLFEAVNNGTIRVLIGSSFKMGAGTNVQQRLVALHHIDAPWRPSDVEQREGRIIRQGNLLYAAVSGENTDNLPADIQVNQVALKNLFPNGFEVEISAYSTSGTSDTVMWQILERKARSIEAFRSDKLINDSEESDSNQYAEFMAATTGNPVFLDKLVAERDYQIKNAEISGLLMAKGSAKNQIHRNTNLVSTFSHQLEAFSNIDFNNVVVGGQSFTLEEVQKTQRIVDSATAKLMLDFKDAKINYDKELAKWQRLSVAKRGKKPVEPRQPARLTIYDKAVLTKSMFSQAILYALQSLTKYYGIEDDQCIIKLDGGYSVMLHRDLKGYQNSGNMRATIYIVHDETQAEIEIASRLFSRNTKLENSVFILNALNIAELHEFLPKKLNEIEKELETAEKNLAALNRVLNTEVDDSIVEVAKEKMDWLIMQVGFIEEEERKIRLSKDNEYIAQDNVLFVKSTGKAQPLPEFEVYTEEFLGENYKVTGERYKNYKAAIRQSDNCRVALVMSRDADEVETTEGVIVKPEGIEDYLSEDYQAKQAELAKAEIETKEAELAAIVLTATQAAEEAAAIEMETAQDALAEAELEEEAEQSKVTILLEAKKEKAKQAKQEQPSFIEQPEQLAFNF